MWWRYKYVYGAPYPPRVECDLSEHFSWRQDLRVALRNPPNPRRYAHTTR
jgi:hypothetical protein